VIARRSDLTGFHRLFYPAARLAEVKAIVELTLSRKGHAFRGSNRTILPLYIHKTEFHACRGINDPAAAGKVEHFRKSRGVEPFPLQPLTLRVFRSQSGKSAFRKEDFPTPEWPLRRLILPWSCLFTSSSPSPVLYAHADHAIAYRFVHRLPFFEPVLFFFAIEIGLIEEQYGGDVIGFVGDEKTIDKPLGGAGFFSVTTSMDWSMLAATM